MPLRPDSAARSQGAPEVHDSRSICYESLSNMVQKLDYTCFLSIASETPPARAIMMECDEQEGEGGMGGMGGGMILYKAGRGLTLG